MSLPLERPAPNGLAFGFDPARQEYYSLRQARYDALAQDVSDWAASSDGPWRVLIVGCGEGTELRYLEHKPHFDRLRVSGANINDRIYKRDSLEASFVGDLMRGYADIPSGYYDVVICEQVLEHLLDTSIAIATLERVLKPGGRLIVGVPIFPPLLRAARQYLVPVLDRLTQHRPRGHVQAFSLSSFLRVMTTHSTLRPIKARGFRIISGGVLRPLENHRWWWRLNRWLGERLPGWCIEVQVVMAKA